MIRVLLIVAMVGVFLATGVAGADTAQVRHPLDVGDEPPGSSTIASVVVERGDHLWKISADHLGPGTDDRVVAPYWREVVTVNTPHLRSGDPDLIFPGEVVELPATPVRP